MSSTERPRLVDVTSRRINQMPSTGSDRALDRRVSHHTTSPDLKSDLLQATKSGRPSHVVENKHLSTVLETERDHRRDSQLSVSTNSSVPSWGGRKRKTHIGPWLLGRTLGKGATSRVRKAKHDVTGVEAAVKIISRNAATGQRTESVVAMDQLLETHPRWVKEKRIPFGIEREIVIMKLIEHPNITRLYDVWENRGEMYLILELVEGGDLFDHIVDTGALPEMEAVRLFRQILAGIGHCHRFRLCHRDLKPENILLDPHGNVKIADFGMASMQHAQWLQASCGSPHYAAPEIARGFPYEGEKVDIWSMGVVLYVLLTGTVPFGAHANTNDSANKQEQMNIILSEVIYKDAYIPEWVSKEAADLLSQLLSKEPSQRPSIEGIWNHPWILKHGGYVKHPRGPNKWSEGPEPLLTEADCGPPLRNISQVDLDIISSLCILWHTADADGVVKALLSPEYNYEQVIYQRLLRYRKEQEENFQGVGVGVSASDHHHDGRNRLRKISARNALAIAQGKRQASQFSIVADPSRKTSSHSRRTGSEAGTEQSYDPFRSSRPQMPIGGTESAKVTLLHSSLASSAVSLRKGNSITAKTPSVTVQDYSSDHFLSSPPHQPETESADRLHELRHTRLSRGYSRSSFGSSVFSYSSSRRGRRSASHKRGVSFAHLKRQGSKSPTPPLRPKAPSPLSMHERYKQDHDPLVPAQLTITKRTDTKPTSPIKSRKEGTRDTGSPGKNKGSNRYSAYLNQEARQVSRELGQYCDNAFKESVLDIRSQGLTEEPTKSGTSHRQTGPAPPPRKSSVNNQTTRYNAPRKVETYLERPLPAPPSEMSPTDEALGKLHKAQAALVAEADSMPPEELKRSLAAINKMIQTAQADKNREDARRIASAPERDTRSADLLSPTKPEERRHVSEPTPRHKKSTKATTSQHGWGAAQATIRIVHEPDLSLAPAPLIVRKKSSEPLGRVTTNNTSQKKPFSISLAPSVSANQAPSLGISHVRPSRTRWSSDEFRHSGLDQLDVSLETIAEAECESNTNVYVPSKRSSKEGNKLKHLFRRSGSTRSSESSDYGPPPPAKDARSSLVPETNHPFKPTPGRFPIDEISEDLEFEDVPPEKTPRKRGFLSFLSWKSAKTNKSELTVFEDDDESTTTLSTTLTGRFNNRSTLSVANANSTDTKSVKFKDSTSRVPRSLGNVEPQNWFARFLHVKPAKHIVALQMSRIAALKEVRAILRDWRRHGMRDIVSERTTGRLWAKVDAENSLRIKPVAIAVEFFTVLQRGRKNNLSVARFVQEQGARTSFDRVVKTMEDVLSGRGLLVSERKKTREMRKCFKQWESGQD